MAKEEYTELVLTLVLAQKGSINGVHSSDLKTEVETLFLVQGAENSTDFFAYDENFPGYLRGRMDGKTLYAPWHLAEHLPSSPLLSKIISISDILKLHQDNPICLSGSAAFLKSVPSISDLDFCEYFVSAASAGSEFAQKFAGRSEYVPCTLSYDGKDIPFDDSWNTSIDAAAAGNFASQIKVDVVYDDKDLEIAATNVVIPLLTKEQIAGPKSWTYQEAVITNDSHPPRSLVDVKELQSYVDWLRNEAGSLNAKDPGKALKRAASLAALLSLDDHLIGAINLLNNETYRGLMTEKRQKEVIRFLSKIGAKYAKEKMSESDEPKVHALLGEMKVKVDTILAYVNLVEQEIIDAYQ